jgi:hypothetical protein
MYRVCADQGCFGSDSAAAVEQAILDGVDAINYWVPGIHISGQSGLDVGAFLASHTGVTATFTQGQATGSQGDVMAAFRSRGGPGQALGVSKPDIAAPGVQILAGIFVKRTPVQGLGYVFVWGEDGMGRKSPVRCWEKGK